MNILNIFAYIESNHFHNVYDKEIFRFYFSKKKKKLIIGNKQDKQW